MMLRRTRNTFREMLERNIFRAFFLYFTNKQFYRDLFFVDVQIPTSDEVVNLLTIKRLAEKNANLKIVRGERKICN